MITFLVFTVEVAFILFLGFISYILLNLTYNLLRKIAQKVKYKLAEKEESENARVKFNESLKKMGCKRVKKYVNVDGSELMQENETLRELNEYNSLTNKHYKSLLENKEKLKSRV